MNEVNITLETSRNKVRIYDYMYLRTYVEARYDVWYNTKV